MGIRSYLTSRRKSRGQSLVELALFIPILLIMLSGMIEVGYGLNMYLNLIDAVREGARYGADADPDPTRGGRDLDIDENGVDDGTTDINCKVRGATDPADPIEIPENTTTEGLTKDFYGKIFCVIQRAAVPLFFDPGKDEVIVSVWRIYRDPCLDAVPPTCTTGTTPPKILDRWPNPGYDPTGDVYPREWHRFGGLQGASRVTTTTIQSYINANLNSTLSSGLLVVEAFYRHKMLMNLPWVSWIGYSLGDVDGTLPFYTFTIIPVSAAEPRPTPTITPSPTYTPVPIPINCAGSGLTWERWNNQAGATVPADNDPLYATTPDLTGTVATSDMQSTLGLINYVRRVSGLVCIPLAGTYTFFLVGDNNTIFKFNPTRQGSGTGLTQSTWDDLMAGANPQAVIADTTAPYEWNDAAEADQESDPLLLAAGYYYIEVLQKQDADTTNGDHFSVAMRTSGTIPANGDTTYLIPSSQLYPRDLNPPIEPPATSTLTPTPTETPVNTPTATGTPTATPTDVCIPGQVSLNQSSMTVNGNYLWADGADIDGESRAQITLWLKDTCGNDIIDTNYDYNPDPSLSDIVIASSRGVSDTITFFQRVNGLFIFYAKSTYIGASTYSAQVAPMDGQPRSIVISPPAGSDVNYTCVSGSFASGSNSTILQLLYRNTQAPYPQAIRRLTRLTVHWQPASGRNFDTVAMGSQSNLVWNTALVPPGSTTSPVDIGEIGGGLPFTWTGSNRLIGPGAQRTLLLNFNYSLSNTLLYTVITRWDDGSGSRVCDAAPVVQNFP